MKQIVPLFSSCVTVIKIDEDIKEFKTTSITLGLQKPIFITGSFSGNEGDLKQRVNAWQFSIGYRQILDISIPFLE